jgi:predicted cupin superfamily sugar epimerase
MTANEIIEKLQMIPHPEGGFYKETYRHDSVTINKQGGKRSLLTAIYFLIENENKSQFHRLSADEIWFFHLGETIELVMISAGKPVSYYIGNQFELGEVPQLLIPANTWFAAKIKEDKGFALVSCTVAPGFTFEDFELGNKNDLLHDFPDALSAINLYMKSP